MYKIMVTCTNWSWWVGRPGTSQAAILHVFTFIFTYIQIGFNAIFKGKSLTHR